jgi:hypothetical protein
MAVKCLRGHTYYGAKTGAVRVNCASGRPLSPSASWSAHPFTWGEDGPGAGHLALAILNDYLHNPPLAEVLHERFARQVLAKLPAKQAFVLTSEQIDLALAPIAEALHLALEKVGK